MENRLFGQTDIGKARDNNEDAFLAESIGGSSLLLAVVIDGVGGYEGGEVAAAIAQTCIRKSLAGLDRKNILPALITAIKNANQEIFTHKSQDPALDKMACVLTLVVADPEQNQFYYAHVGDTRLYLLRDKALVKITQDQSFVGFLEDSGRLTEAAAMQHPKRNEINQALGLEETDRLRNDFIETGQSPFLPGDLLLLCSDGLTDRIDKEKITALLDQDHLPVMAQALIDAANAAGGHDNITVVLVKNDKIPAQHQPAKPAAKQEAEVSVPSPAPVPFTKNPVKVVRNRGWVVLLLLLSAGLLGLSGWLYMQLELIQHQVRPLAPVYENPWQPVQPGLDTLKKPLRDSVYYTDSVAKPLKPHGKRSDR